MTYEIFNEAIRVLESKGVVFLETKPGERISDSDCIDPRIRFYVPESYKKKLSTCPALWKRPFKRIYHTLPNVYGLDSKEPVILCDYVCPITDLTGDTPDDRFEKMLLKRHQRLLDWANKL